MTIAQALRDWMQYRIEVVYWAYPSDFKEMEEAIRGETIELLESI